MNKEINEKKQWNEPRIVEISVKMTETYDAYCWYPYPKHHHHHHHHGGGGCYDS